MRQTLHEGLGLAQQLVALPFRAAREAVRETSLGRRPIGEVVTESLCIGEDLAKLPWKAAEAILAELGEIRPDLERRVANLEQRLGVDPADST